MSCPPRRLTQQFVESLAWNGKRTFIRDSDLKGAGLQSSISDVVTFDDDRAVQLWNNS